MKKALSLLLALVLCLSLCACGTGTKADEITLTTENYKDYLTVTPHCGPYGTETIVGGKRYCPGVWTEVNVEGVSDNFNYNDVSIVVKIYVTFEKTIDSDYNYLGSKTMEFEITIDTNIAGDGVSEHGLHTLDYYMRDQSITKWEIVSISGTLTPAG